MKTFRMLLAALAAVSTCMVAVAATADMGKAADKDKGARLSARLIGYDEVPSVSTPARGRFRATVSPDGNTIDYTLSFDGIASTVNQSHIHFAQKSVNGAIVIWLCQGATRAPAAVALLTPECPVSPGGEVTGTITAAQVLAQAAGSGGAAQQIQQGELDEVLAAVKAGSAYVNVHSSTSPGGEIRGQIKGGDDDHN